VLAFLQQGQKEFDMRRSLIAAALLFALAGTGCDSATDDTTFFQAALSGSNEVPPAGTAASGVCGFQNDGGAIRYSIEAHGLSNVIGAHIHIGAAGVNGPVRVVLFPFPGGPAVDTANPVASVDGVLRSGTFDNSHVTGGLTFDDVLSAMTTGNAYCNVHTTRFPGGEIRGQIAVVSTD
jgi:hypothetical protein